MRAKTIALVTAVGLVGALLVPALVPAAKVQLTSQLKGSNEVPGPGDDDASGRAEIKLRQSERKVCFKITFKNMEDPSAGHIHEGKKGVAGDVVVPLFETPSTSGVGGCVKKVKKSVIAAIARNPNHYYVNLHNTEFPDGAIRGQLKLRPGT
jgi:hypothetical protein